MFVQEEVAKLAMTAIEYPPMQKGASFNLEAVKAKIEEAVKAQCGQVNRAGAVGRGDADRFAAPGGRTALKR